MEKWKKVRDNFYKMDEGSIVTLWKELLDDFFALAETHLKAIRKLIERLEVDQRDTQLQFQIYEWEHRRKELGKRVAAINISDEEQSAKPQPQPQPEEQSNQQEH